MKAVKIIAHFFKARAVLICLNCFFYLFLSGQTSDTTSINYNSSRFLSELGIGYAHTLDGRKADFVLQYNIGYKYPLSSRFKLNAMVLTEGINTGRAL